MYRDINFYCNVSYPGEFYSNKSLLFPCVDDVFRLIITTGRTPCFRVSVEIS